MFFTFLLICGILLSATVSAGEDIYKPCVIVLGVDGLGTPHMRGMRTLENLVSLPNEHNTIYSLDTGSDILNFSGPNWYGVLSGFGSESHAVRSNECERSQFHDTVFDIMETNSKSKGASRKEGSYKTGLIAEWDVLQCYPLEDSVDYRHNTYSTIDTVETTIQFLSSNADSLEMLFVHFDAVDHAGHQAGAISPEYATAMRDVDAAIDTIVRQVKGHPALRGRCSIIVVSDHGHDATSTFHALPSMPVPFFLILPENQSQFVKFGEMSDMKNRYVASLIAHILHMKNIPLQWKTDFEQAFSSHLERGKRIPARKGGGRPRHADDL